MVRLETIGASLHRPADLRLRTTPRPTSNLPAKRHFPSLPIVDALPALTAAMAEGVNAVLQAPPGAGKTTVVPLALLDSPWLGADTLVMLEPRRLAARAAAHRMAYLLGERVGETVGYRVRGDTRVSARTRVEVITEGVLTRMLNSDPTLSGVGAVIFDEFHERSLNADLGLALTLHSQRLVRPELRILVMSATLDGGPVARLLGDAPIVRSEGRLFPIDVRYLPRQRDRHLEVGVVAAVRRALRETEGDCLVFLPGQGEIHRVADRLSNESPGASVDVHALYGNLPFDAQDRAIAPAPMGRRKVVLATSIAETSLTIEGVRCVVDSGVMRVPRFSPAIGMARLETVRVSRASADQRAGRAGRLAPGVCYRLWGAEEHAGLIPFTSPEIVDADLASLALELAVAGVGAEELSWLDPPPAASLAAARGLLRLLSALDASGRVTPHGARMASLAAHPRLAHMLLRAHDAGDGALACDLAALLGDRDIVRAEGLARDADIGIRLDTLGAIRRRERLPESAGGMRVIGDAARRALEEADRWRRELSLLGETVNSRDRPTAAEDPTAKHPAGIRNVPEASGRGAVRRSARQGSTHNLPGVPPAEDFTRDSPDDPNDGAGRVLALAYPDRVAQRRAEGTGRYLLRNGSGAVLRDSPALAQSPYLVVAETDGRRPESAIYLAAPLSLDDISRDFGDQIERFDEVEWDEDTQSIRAKRIERLGAIVLRESMLRDVPSELVTEALLTAVRRSGLALLDWSEAAIRLRERVAFLRAHDDAWPDLSGAALSHALDEWLTPHLAGMRRASDVRSIDLTALLLDRLTWQQRSALDRLAPTHYAAPTGNRHRIDYADPQAPTVSVRLQEMFGETEHPRVLEGRVAVTLHLLSPAHRPVQVTRDIAGFWRTSYFDVRKDMKGRYPRHPWPGDPLTAPPTSRAKPRGS